MIRCLVLLWICQLLGVAKGYSATNTTGCAATNCFAELDPRPNYDGWNNNRNNPSWGAVGSPLKFRTMEASASSNDASLPSARTVLQELYRKDSPRISNYDNDLYEDDSPYGEASTSYSQLWVYWGIFVHMDMVALDGNSSEPLDIPCDDGVVDEQCTSSADTVSYNRTEHTINEDGVRVPVYARTAFLDLDVLYGIDNETADSLRTFDGTGSIKMNATTNLPYIQDDGTWLIADQRMQKHLGTFVLLILLMREHNRRVEVMQEPGWLEGMEGNYTCQPKSCLEWEEEDFYQAARAWTQCVAQHITNDEWAPQTLGKRLDNPVYNDTLDPTHDVFYATAASRFLWSGVGPVIRLMDHNSVPAPTLDPLSVHTAADSDVILEVLTTYGVDYVINGMVNSYAYETDASVVDEVTSYAAINDPVLDIQRARELGVPSYNDAREAVGLERAVAFSDITSDATTAALLEELYGGDIDMVDALVGGLAEQRNSSAIKSVVLSPLFYQSIHWTLDNWRNADYYYHTHMNALTNPYSYTILKLAEDNADPNGTGYSDDLTTTGFEVPSTSTSTSTCSSGYNVDGTCSDTSTTEQLSFNDGVLIVSWMLKTIGGVESIWFNYTCTGMSETSSYCAFGVGSDQMVRTDVWMLEVANGEVTVVDRYADHQSQLPAEDSERGGEDDLTLLSSSFVDSTATVSFTRPLATSSSESTAHDDDTRTDWTITADGVTMYAWSYNQDKAGQMHMYKNRGTGEVTLSSGESTETTSTGVAPHNIFTFHGIIMLAAWGICAPIAFFVARYMKGSLYWLEAHAVLGQFIAETSVPISITAICGSRGNALNNVHGQVGVALLVMVIIQFVTGISRMLAIQNKCKKFVGKSHGSAQHVTAHIHRWLGRCMVMLGIYQLYLGLIIITQNAEGGGGDTMSVGGVGQDTVSLDFHVDLFNPIKDYLFWLFLSIFVIACAVAEYKKLIRRKESPDEVLSKVVEYHLPQISRNDFEERVLNGSHWVIVKDYIINVSDYMLVHPGGSELLMNSIGRDVTAEIEGRGRVSKHFHSSTAWATMAKNAVGRLSSEDNDFSSARNLGEPFLEDTKDKAGSSRKSISKSHSWSGPQFQKMVVMEKVVVNQDPDRPVIRLSLRSAVARQLPELMAGGYVQFRVLSHGQVIQRDMTPVLKRRVTKSSIGDYDVIDYFIRIYPNGAMSRALRKKEIGEPIHVKGPFAFGSLSWSLLDAQNVYMVSAGTGIAPMIQLSHWHARRSIPAADRDAALRAKSLRSARGAKSRAGSIKAIMSKSTRFLSNNLLRNFASARGGDDGGSLSMAVGGAEDGRSLVGMADEEDDDDDAAASRAMHIHLLCQFRDDRDFFCADQLEDMKQEYELLQNGSSFEYSTIITRSASASESWSHRLFGLLGRKSQAPAVQAGPKDTPPDRPGAAATAATSNAGPAVVLPALPPSPSSSHHQGLSSPWPLPSPLPSVPQPPRSPVPRSRSGSFSTHAAAQQAPVHGVKVVDYPYPCMASVDGNDRVDVEEVIQNGRRLSFSSPIPRLSLLMSQVAAKGRSPGDAWGKDDCGDPENPDRPDTSECGGGITKAVLQNLLAPLLAQLREVQEEGKSRRMVRAAQKQLAATDKDDAEEEGKEDFEDDESAEGSQCGAEEEVKEEGEARRKGSRLTAASRTSSVRFTDPPRTRRASSVECVSPGGPQTRRASSVEPCSKMRFSEQKFEDQLAKLKMLAATLDMLPDPAVFEAMCRNEAMKRHRGRGEHRGSVTELSRRRSTSAAGVSHRASISVRRGDEEEKGEAALGGEDAEGILAAICLSTKESCIINANGDDEEEEGGGGGREGGCESGEEEDADDVIDYELLKEDNVVIISGPPAFCNSIVQLLESMGLPEDILWSLD